MRRADDRSPEGADYEALERSIRSSRSRIDDTLDTLRHRIAHVSPRHLMEHKMSRKTHDRSYRGNDSEDIYGREGDAATGRTVMTASHESASSMMGIVRDNPIPLALVGIGLGWLALSGSGYDRRIAHSRAVRSVGHRAGDAASYARDAFYGAADTVRSAAGSAYDSASDALGSASETIRDQAGRLTGSSGEDWQPGRGRAMGAASLHRVQGAVSGAGGRFWDMVEDHPLVAGIMGVALGATLGAALPATRTENRWVGDYADEAAEQAKVLAKDALDRGARVAQAVVETAKEELGDATTAVGEAAKEEARKPA